MNKETSVPRIQGSAFQRSTGKWDYEIVIKFGEVDPIVMGLREDHEGYETKDEALKALKEVAKTVADQFCKSMGAEQIGFYDLKKNALVKEL